MKRSEDMNIKNKNIDGGKAFDWGKTSTYYAKFRDIYPQALWEHGNLKIDISCPLGINICCSIT